MDDAQVPYGSSLIIKSAVKQFLSLRLVYAKVKSMDRAVAGACEDEMLTRPIQC